jgi:hypothetical protein
MSEYADGSMETICPACGRNIWNIVDDDALAVHADGLCVAANVPPREEPSG